MVARHQQSSHAQEMFEKSRVFWPVSCRKRNFVSNTVWLIGRFGIGSRNIRAARRSRKSPPTSQLILSLCKFSLRNHNRRRDRMKLLLWDRTGFGLFYKRVEQGTFQLPTSPSNHASLELRYVELMMILEGIDLLSIKRRRRYHRLPMRGAISIKRKTATDFSPSTLS